MLREDRYATMKYDSKRRFASYWHQIAEVLAHDPDHVLEVGAGTSFVAHYLKRVGVKITTVDIDPERRPDHVASVTKLPFPDNSFSVILACEILEHIPYPQFLTALKELHRVSGNTIIISLPDATHAAAIQFPIPGVSKVKWLLTFPHLFPKEHFVTAHGHQWEIGKKDYPLSRITVDIQKHGFSVEKTYRVFENPYHRFFILRKI